MNEWIVISKPIDVEADIPLEDQAPIEVKQRYNESYKNKFVAWRNEELNLFGCIKNNRSISAKCSEGTILELYEMEPAKGSGYVGLTIKSEDGKSIAAIARARYSEKSLTWLKEIQPILAKTFKLQEHYEYHGKDA